VLQVASVGAPVTPVGGLLGSSAVLICQQANNAVETFQILFFMLVKIMIKILKINLLYFFTYDKTVLWVALKN
jgi:hypothetical protein